MLIFWSPAIITFHCFQLSFTWLCLKDPLHFLFWSVCACTKTPEKMYLLEKRSQWLVTWGPFVINATRCRYFAKHLFMCGMQEIWLKWHISEWHCALCLDTFLFSKTGSVETCPIHFSLFPVPQHPHWVSKEHVINRIKCGRAVKKQSRGFTGSSLGTAGLHYSEVLRWVANRGNHITSRNS